MFTVCKGDSAMRAKVSVHEILAHVVSISEVDWREENE